MCFQTFMTTTIVNGQCLAFSVWKSESYAVGYGVFIFFWTYLLRLGIYIYCYSHILVVIRRRAKVYLGNNADRTAGNTLQANALRSQMNVIKTMMIIITFFVMSLTPNNVYYLLVNLRVNATNINDLESTYYTTIFMVFVNVCGNPFIYASQYNVVKSRINGIFKKKPDTNALHVITAVITPRRRYNKLH